MPPPASNAPAETRTRRKQSWLRRLWRDHEEGVLYAVAAFVYIALGVMLKSVVLNWIVGPLFPLLVVYLVPNGVRRARRARHP